MAWHVRYYSENVRICRDADINDAIQTFYHGFFDSRDGEKTYRLTRLGGFLPSISFPTSGVFLDYKMVIDIGIKNNLSKYNIQIIEIDRVNLCTNSINNEEQLTCEFVENIKNRCEIRRDYWVYSYLRQLKKNNRDLPLYGVPYTYRFIDTDVVPDAFEEIRRLKRFGNNERVSIIKKHLTLRILRKFQMIYGNMGNLFLDDSVYECLAPGFNNRFFQCEYFRVPD